MSAAVGAALKKIAIAILSNKNAIKTVGTIVLIILIVILMPIIAIVGVFSGGIEIDTDRLSQMVIENMSQEESAMLMEIESTMSRIESSMSAAGYSERVQEAQVLYVIGLSGYASDSGFVDRLVSCFAESQTDAQLVSAVNSRFSTSISVDDFHSIMDGIRAVKIDIRGYVSPETKNNLDLVTWAVNAEQAGWGYVWGTYGTVLTRTYLYAKAEQYPDHVGAMEDFIKRNWMGRRTADCVGLIKGYGWLNPETLAIEYGTHGMPDISADDMYRSATEKGAISTIPEIPGLAVWKEGHIGIYIGNGYVIEAMGTRYGVRKTELKNRSWTHWLKIPYITYEQTN